MLRIFRKLREMNFSSLMSVYAESNRENAREFYPSLSESEGRFRVEQGFYTYLKEDFFQSGAERYCVWEECGRYFSALRLESYRDGLLVEALETAPEARKMGYAMRLLTAVKAELREQGGGLLYSHVDKNNIPSLAVHRACGFEWHLDHAVYVDGSVMPHICTLRLEIK